jgi:hypothetical protein
MSKKNDGDQFLGNQADPTPPGDDTPADSNPDLSGNDGKPGGGGPDPSGNDASVNPTIEEHARNMKIDAPVFAAVMQSEKWAGGKRVPEKVFKEAVEGFLKAPMGGGKAPKNEEKK